MTKENKFYYSFITLFSIYFYFEIWSYTNYRAPISFYFPQSFFGLTPNIHSFYYSLIKYLAVSLIFYAFINIDILKTSRLFSWILTLLCVVLIVSRFNYYHYPYLEMYPLLALAGFASARKTDEKIFTAIGLVTLIYFFSGLTKLRYGGLDWLSSEKLYSTLLYSLRNRDAYIYLPQNLFAELKPHFVVIGIGTLIFELLMPLVLFCSKLRRPYFYITCVFHILIFLVFRIYSMGVIFPMFLFYCFAFSHSEESATRPKTMSQSEN